MKLFYSYMWRLFAHISTHSKVVRIPLKIFSPANQRHRLVMPGRCFLLIFCFISFSLNDARPQSPEKSGAVSGNDSIQPLVVGQKLPDEFWKKEQLFYVNGDTVRRSLEEYKGKLLILDFWASWCGACRANFPKLTKLKESFGEDINIILVNPLVYRDNIEKITKAYSEFTDSTTSNLGSIVMDEYIIDHFPHVGIPRYIWINPKGRFIATTGNLFVDSEQIKKILEGKY